MDSFVDIIYINDDNEILLLKRCDDCDLFPSKWGLPGGHVEDGSLLDNAIRELMEETNIVPKTLTCVDNHSFKNGSHTTVYILFSNNAESTDIKICHNEHQDYLFAPLQDVINGKYDLMPEIIDYLIDIFTE